jgi:hypothetical protein
MAPGFAFAMTRIVISLLDQRSLLGTYHDDKYNGLKINKYPSLRAK